MTRLIIRFALKNIRSGGLKSIAAALVCFVCAAFFTAEALSLWSYKNNNTLMLDNMFGVHNGIFACGSDTLSNINNGAGFTETGTLSVLYHAVRSETFSDRKIVIGTADENALKLQRIHLSEGRFPENEHEIALERTVADILFPKAKIGDIITVEITLPEACRKEFVLCGILSNFSNLQWDPAEKTVPMVNALIAGGNSQTALYSFVSILGEVSEHEQSGVVYYPNQRDNYDTLKAISGVSSDASAVIIIVILAMFTLAVMIIAAYAISRGCENQIGLMKTAGFSGKTILFFLAVKSALLFVPSSIIGTAAGAAIPALSGGLPAGAVVLAAVCCAAVIVVFLSANLLFAQKECGKTVIENLRQSSRVIYGSSVGFTSENAILLYSVKSFLINGKETAASCVMVFLSSLLLFIILSLSAQIDNELKDMERPYDMALSFADKTITSVNVSEYGEDGLSNNEFEALRAHDDVKYALGCKRLYVYELDESKLYSSQGSENDDSFETDKERLGFPDCAVSENRLYGLDDNSLPLLRSYLVEGHIDTNALSSGKSAVWLRRDGNNLNHSAGDMLKLAYVINREPEHPTYDDLEYFEIEVEISAVIDIPADGVDETASMLRSCIQGGIIWSEKAFDRIGVEKHYDSVYLRAADNAQSLGALFAIIEDMKIYYGERFTVYDHLQNRMSLVRFRDAFDSISFLLTGGMALFSLVSLALVTSAKYAKRKKVFGFLRAVGLTKRHTLGIIFLENALSVLLAFVLGIVCGAVPLLIMDMPASGLGTLLGAELFYLAAVMAIGVCAAHRIFKYSIIDCIRCE